MIINDVVCPFCGCLCDDLELEVEGDRILRVQNGCSLAEATFMNDTRLPAPIRRTSKPGGKRSRTMRRLMKLQIS